MLNKIIIPQESAWKQVLSIAKGICAIVIPIILIIMAIEYAPIIPDHAGAIIILCIVLLVGCVFVSEARTALHENADDLGTEVDRRTLAKFQESGLTVSIEGKTYPNVPKHVVNQVRSECYHEVQEERNVLIKEELLRPQMVQAMNNMWQRNALVIPYWISSALFSIYYIIVFLTKGTMPIDWLMVGIIGAMLCFMGLYRFYWNEVRTLRYQVLCDMSDAKVVTKQLFHVNEKGNKATTKLETLLGDISLEIAANNFVHEHVIQKTGRFFNYYVFNNTDVEHDDLRLFAYAK